MSDQQQVEDPTTNIEINFVDQQPDKEESKRDDSRRDASGERSENNNAPSANDVS